MIRRAPWHCRIRLVYTDVVTQWTPKPDYRFEYLGTYLPLLVCEFESGTDQVDRWRLLAQAGVYLRLASLLDLRHESGAEARPIVLACYLYKSLEVELYLMTTKDDGQVRSFELGFHICSHLC